MDKAKAKSVISRIDEFVSTARRVKGDNFAAFVLFMVDMSQIIHINRILADYCVEHGGEDRVGLVQYLTQAVMTQATTRMAEVFNLSESDLKEAVKLCDQIVDSLMVKET